MTWPSKWNPTPPVLAVTCPKCGGEARFEFAVYRQVVSAHRPWFRRSNEFELLNVHGQGGAEHPVMAVYYPGLRGRALHTIRDFPAGMSPQQFGHSPYDRLRINGSAGTLSCLSCDIRRKHRLTWPNDAWFQVVYRGRVLWAFDRDMAIRLVAYIEGKLRPHPDSQLLRVPSHFRTAKARVEVTKRLLLRLGPGASHPAAARPGRAKKRKVHRGA